MGNEKMRLCLAMTFASALLTAGFCRTSIAADAASPAGSPAPAPSLVVSDKAPLGCCCISQDVAAGAKPGCGYGISEDKCRVAGKTLPSWGSTWTPGKCPAPERAPGK
jgi:hypothetical protein